MLWYKLLTKILYFTLLLIAINNPHSVIYGEGRALALSPKNRQLSNIGILVASASPAPPIEEPIIKWETTDIGTGIGADTDTGTNTGIKSNDYYNLRPPATPRLKVRRNKHRILFIGDSHSATVFGKTLIYLLEHKIRMAEVTSVSSCGSSPMWWFDSKPTTCGLWQRDADGNIENTHTGTTPDIYALITEVKPDIIIVALGTNLIPEEPMERNKYAEKLMRVVAAEGRQCFWIGPPDTKKFTAEQINDVYLMLMKFAKVYHCHLVDSRNYTTYPSTGKDGVHYSGKQGETILKGWARQVYKDIDPLIRQGENH